MGNQQACQCCGGLEYADDAEVDVNGDIHKTNKGENASLPIQNSSDMDDNSFAAGRYPRAPSRNGGKAFASGILEETRDEAGEAACCSERGAAHGTASRYRKKPSSIMVQDGAAPGGESVEQNPAVTGDIADTGSFSSISDAETASILADPRAFNMNRVAPPSQSLSMDSYGDHTDYAICREMMDQRMLAEARDDCQDESRDDV